MNKINNIYSSDVDGDMTIRGNLTVDGSIVAHSIISDVETNNLLVNSITGSSGFLNNLSVNTLSVTGLTSIEINSNNIISDSIGVSSLTVLSGFATEFSTLELTTGHILANSIGVSSLTVLNGFVTNFSALSIDSDAIVADLIGTSSLTVLLGHITGLSTTNITSNNILVTNLAASNFSTLKMTGLSALFNTSLETPLIYTTSISSITIDVDNITATNMLVNNLTVSSISTINITASGDIKCDDVFASKINNLIIGTHDAADELQVVDSGKHIFGNSIASTPANLIFNPKVLYPISNTPASINPLQSVHSKHMEETLMTKSLFINGQIGLNVSNLNDIISGYGGTLGETILSQYLPDATVNVNVDAYLNSTSTFALNVRDLILSNPVSRILARDVTDPSKVINNIHPLAPGAMITADDEGYLINSYPTRNPFETWDNFKTWKNLKDAEKVANDTRLTLIEAKNTAQDGTIATLQTKNTAQDGTIADLDLKDVKE